MLDDHAIGDSSWTRQGLGFATSGMVTHDPTSLTLLEEAGPFESAAFRRCATASSNWRDVSFGGRLQDGTRIAIALLKTGAIADSVPPGGYGAIRSDRRLTQNEVTALLAAARTSARAQGIRVRALASNEPPPGSTPIASAWVVPLEGVDAPADRYARITRRSVARAREAGCRVRTSSDPARFLALYAEASRSWRTRYPHDLIQALVAAGIARCDDVVLDGEVVSSLLTLVGREHWMCWLAAQSARGRTVSASYLAYTHVLDHAHEVGVRAVNLGGSIGGGAEFKGHLGAKPIPVVTWVDEGWRVRVGTSLRGIARQVQRRTLRALSGGGA